MTPDMQEKDFTEAYEAINQELANIRDFLSDEPLKFRIAMDVDESLDAIATRALELCLALKNAKTP